MKSLKQAYVATCQTCSRSLTLYTRYQNHAKRSLTESGWGTSQGEYYCPYHVKEARQIARQQAKQA